MALVLGPVLRYVVGDRATVWVETDGKTTVTVRAGEAVGAARTFTAFGRHYALVVVDGLPPASATPYRVYLDDDLVWPPADYAYPVPVIRTRDDAAPVRIVFGSCREASPYALSGLPPDALDAYAVRLARTQRDWPDLVLLLGDQIYADVTSPATRRWLRRRRARRRRHIPGPENQVVDFTEYARVYRESWCDPEIRWLLSTVPSAMIFDDHEVIDDWNISASWRADVTALPWWRERITAGLASYWVYQHLGNLHPDELGRDPLYPTVVSAADATQALRDFGLRTDTDRSAYRWSYARDVGRTRIVVLDNRCARLVEPGARAMLPPAQWEWFAGTVRAGGYDHLAVGSSLPWLMPHAIHHLEVAVSALAESPRSLVARGAERVRRWVDLEHWPAFGTSFEALAALLGQAAAGDFGPVPASVSVLSGDVHHSYVARAALPGAPVHQLTCSPVHNRVPPTMRAVFRAAWGPRATALGRLLCRVSGCREERIGWQKLAGPYFGNAVGTLVHSGRSARVTVEGTDPAGHLVPVADVELA